MTTLSTQDSELAKKHRLIGVPFTDYYEENTRFVSVTIAQRLAAFLAERDAQQASNNELVAEWAAGAMMKLLKELEAIDQAMKGKS